MRLSSQRRTGTDRQGGHSVQNGGHRPGFCGARGRCPEPSACPRVTHLPRVQPNRLSGHDGTAMGPACERQWQPRATSRSVSSRLWPQRPVKSARERNICLGVLKKPGAALCPPSVPGGWFASAAPSKSRHLKHLEGSRRPRSPVPEENGLKEGRLHEWLHMPNTPSASHASHEAASLSTSIPKVIFGMVRPDPYT